MPKARTQSQPYDPIAADLVRDVTAHGRLGLAPRRRNGVPDPVEPPVEPTITKRFQLTRSEDAELNAFLLRLQTASGSKVSVSIIVRAALAAVVDAEPSLRENLSGRRFRLPSTHDRLGLGEYEEIWKGVLRESLRKDIQR